MAVVYHVGAFTGSTPQAACVASAAAESASVGRTLLAWPNNTHAPEAWTLSSGYCASLEPPYGSAGYWSYQFITSSGEPDPDPDPETGGSGTTITCSVSPCAVTVTHEVSLPPFQLSPADGGLISGAILLVWATGWAIRMLIRALHVDGVSKESEDG